MAPAIKLETQAISKKLSKEDKKTKSKLLQEIHEELELDVEYFIALVAASLIALFGLVTNNVAVIIGGMLVAPIFWPILGIAMGIITQRRKILRSALISTSVSILVVIIIGYIGSFLNPLNQITSEIDLRSHPNIIDLLIALASSVVGVAALRFSKISTSTTGVAISLSLLPALVVTGIGIKLGNATLIFGSLLLFAANATAIVFAGCITLILLGVRPEYEKEEQRFKIGFSLSVIAIIILAIPLSIFLKQSTTVALAQNKTKAVFNEKINQIQPTAQIEDLSIDVNQDLITIKANLLVPENTVLSAVDREELISTLQTQLDSEINLKLNVINTVSLHKANQDNQAEFEKSLLLNVNRIVQAIDPNFEVYQIEITSKSVDAIEANVILIKKDGYTFSLENQAELIQTLEKLYNLDIKMNVSLLASQSVPLAEVNLQNEVEGLLLELDDKIKIIQFSANSNNPSGKIQISVIVLYPRLETLEPDIQTQITDLVASEIPNSEIEVVVINY